MRLFLVFAVVLCSVYAKDSYVSDHNDKFNTAKNFLRTAIVMKTPASTLQLNENLSFNSLATSNNDIKPLATKSEEGADGERISVAAIIAFSVGGFVLIMVAITAIYCCFFVSETTTGTDGVVYSNTPHHAVVNTESDSHEHDPTTTIDQQQEFREEERESLNNGIQLVNTNKTNYV